MSQFPSNEDEIESLRAERDMYRSLYSDTQASLTSLQVAIRSHRDQRGDDRCWLDDIALYGALPEGAPDQATLALPSKEMFLANCARYHTSRQAPGTTPDTGLQGRWCSRAELAGAWTMPPEVAASSFISIHRCLGNLASGNDAECHKYSEPGGYDIVFAMMPINTQEPFATFEEAMLYAQCFQKMLGLAIKCDREKLIGKHNEGPWDLESLQEIDVFDGRNAYVTVEKYLKGLSGRPKIHGGLRKCSYGWLARWCPRNTKIDEMSYFWPDWEKDQGPLVLVLPPTGEVVRLPKAKTIKKALQVVAKKHRLPKVYKCAKDYDILVDAGVEDWRAEAVLANSATHADIAHSAYTHGSLYPKYAEAARVIIERAQREARTTG